MIMPGPARTPVQRLGIGHRLALRLLALAGIAIGSLLLGPVVAQGLGHLPWLTNLFLSPEPTELVDPAGVPATVVGIDTSDLADLGLDLPVVQGPIPIEDGVVLADDNPLLKAAQVKIVDANGTLWQDDAEQPDVTVFVAVVQMVTQDWANAAMGNPHRSPAGDGYPAEATVATDSHGDTVLESVRFVHDRLLVEVDVETSQDWRDAHPDADQAALARQVALRVDDGLPQVADLPDSGRLSLRSERVLANSMFGVAVALTVLAQRFLASMRDAGTREVLSNRLTRTIRRDPAHLVDVRRAARWRRRSSLLRSVAAALGAGLAVLAVTVLTGPLPAVPSAAIAASALFVAVAIGHLARSQRGGLDRAAFRRVSALHAIGAAFGAVMVAAGAFWISLGVSELMFGDLAYKVGTLVYFSGGLVVWQLAAVPPRLAERLIVPTRRRAVQQDDRAPVFLLRSFQDDALRIRVHEAGGRTALERISLSSEARFEEVLAWRAWRHGPVLAVGKPGTGLQPLGAARDYYEDDEWQGAVRARLAEARVVLVLVGRTPGAYWELERLREDEVLHRAVFVFPPVEGSELFQRIHVLAGALHLDTAHIFADLSPATRLVGLRLTEQGELVRYVTDGRDDIAYLLALDDAIEHIAWPNAVSLGEPAEALRAETKDVSHRLVHVQRRSIDVVANPVQDVIERLVRLI